MPNLPLPQMLYLGGVLCAFATFMAALAWAYFQANRRSAPTGQGAEARAVGQTQATGAFQTKGA